MPMPPSHCVMLRHIRIAAGTASMSTRIEAAVVRMKPVAAGARLHGGQLANDDTIALAAAAGTAAPSIGEITPEMYRRQFDINVAGTLFVIQAVVPGMKRRGAGAIINFSSQAGRRGEPNISLYCATKAAIISITQSLALELAASGIRVNAIAPGVIDTPMWDVVDGLFARYENKPVGQKKREVGGDRPYLGTIPDFGREVEGYALMGAAKDSPADRAGIKAGDVIVKFGDRKIAGLEDIDGALRKFKAGDKVPVIILRDGKEQEVTVTLAPPR